MATRVVVDWVFTGADVADNYDFATVVSHAPSAYDGSTTGAMADNNRPTAPTRHAFMSKATISGANKMCARVTVISGMARINWGVDAKASTTKGVLLVAGQTELLGVEPGDRVAVQEVT